MPLKALKSSTAEALTIEWVLHVQNFKLNLDKKRCVGCQICSLVCPKNAINTVKQPKDADQKTRRAAVDIELPKCNFCGICDVTCPYGAIRVTIGGKHILSVVEKGSFPQLIREIEVNPCNLPSGTTGLEEICPLNLVHFATPLSQEEISQSIHPWSEAGRARAKLDIDIEKEHCPCCGACETKLPDAIHVRKFFNGKITIYREKCPTGCRNCLDVCPITGTLYISNQEGKVRVNELYCTYCGACKIVCPVDQALELKRTHVSHTPVRSGTWNKTLERLASSIEMTKELKTKGSSRARESVINVLGSKESD